MPLLLRKRREALEDEILTYEEEERLLVWLCHFLVELQQGGVIVQRMSGLIP